MSGLLHTGQLTIKSIWLLTDCCWLDVIQYPFQLEKTWINWIVSMKSSYQFFFHFASNFSHFRQKWVKSLGCADGHISLLKTLFFNSSLMLRSIDSPIQISPILTKWHPYPSPPQLFLFNCNLNYCIFAFTDSRIWQYAGTLGYSALCVFKILA